MRRTARSAVTSDARLPQIAGDEEYDARGEEPGAGVASKVVVVGRFGRDESWVESGERAVPVRRRRHRPHPDEELWCGEHDRATPSRTQDGARSFTPVRYGQVVWSSRPIRRSKGRPFVGRPSGYRCWCGRARSYAIEATLRHAIIDGRLLPGTRLPSSRLLAAELGCARATVVAAYEQLVAEGYLLARVGEAPPSRRSAPPSYFASRNLTSDFHRATSR